MESYKMFALCHPLTELSKTLENRVLYGEGGGALLFQTERDAQNYRDVYLQNYISMTRIQPVIEEVSICKSSEYRLMVRLLDTAPSLSVQEEMKRIMEKHWTTIFYKFQATHEDLPAQIRAVLWMEGISMKRIGEGRALVRLQRRKPDTRSELAKKLGDIPPEWEDVPYSPQLEYEVVVRDS